MSRWKWKIPKEGDPTHWITTTKGESVEVYSEAVFIVEGGGTDHFFTKGEGEEIVGRIAPDPFEEYCDLTVALVPVKQKRRARNEPLSRLWGLYRLDHHHGGKVNAR